MTLDSETVLRLWREPPEEFAQRLVIENLLNQNQTLAPAFVEQIAALELLRLYRRVIAIKPRQVGFTTLFTLFLFAKAYRADHPRVVLQTAQDVRAQKRVRRMVDVAYNGLPQELQFGMKANMDRTEFAHNKAQFQRFVAGQRGQGRSYTFNDYHATEMAFYPSGSSAHGGSDTAADEDLYASIQAAMHDPTGHLVVESTGNGPRGLFYRLVMAAQRGMDGTGFLFIPWSKVNRYRMKVPAGWERRPDEDELAAQFGLDDEQLAWRRHRIEVDQMTVIRFRREYPLTFLEPFLLDQSVWFDQESLNEMSAVARLEHLKIDGALHTFLEPQEGRRYFIGMDTAGGVGRDEATIVVLRDDLEHVASWSSARAAPDEQAGVLVDLARKYNALVLVEANKYGKQVLELADAAGLRLWVNEDKRWWYGTGQRGGDSKREMMTHARWVVRERVARCRDPKGILQLQMIVEDSRGRIQARGDEHDDRAIAWCLALWCAKDYAEHVEQVSPADEAARLQREAVAKFEQQWGRRG